MKDDPIWNIHRSGQPKAHDTPPAPPSPPDTRGVDYAAYCEGVAAQLAGNPNIPTSSTASHRQIAAHALGRIDASSAGIADLYTQVDLIKQLDKLFVPPISPSAT